MQIHLEAHPPRGGDQHRVEIRVEIRAEVTGPQRRLRYRWFSVLGECDPHESDAPVPRVQVEITRVPPYEPDGGPNTRGEIAGRVSGELTGSCAC